MPSEKNRKLAPTLFLVIIIPQNLHVNGLAHTFMILRLLLLLVEALLSSVADWSSFVARNTPSISPYFGFARVRFRLFLGTQQMDFCFGLWFFFSLPFSLLWEPREEFGFYTSPKRSPLQTPLIGLTQLASSRINASDASRTTLRLISLKSGIIVEELCIRSCMDIFPVDRHRLIHPLTILL